MSKKRIFIASATYQEGMSCGIQIQCRGSYRKIDFDDGMIDSLNVAIASSAINWIVADNIDQLEEFKSEALKFRDSESIYTPAKYLFKGTSFKDW